MGIKERTISCPQVGNGSEDSSTNNFQMNKDKLFPDFAIFIDVIFEVENCRNQHCLLDKTFYQIITLHIYIIVIVMSYNVSLNSKLANFEPFFLRELQGSSSIN
jgi:hypothetical protein